MPDGAALIDALRGTDGALDRTAIKRILPYGDDFLFVDRVSRLEPKEVEAAFRIPDDAAYLRSHFVDSPVMPGVLIGEGLAQAGSVMVRYRLESPDQQHVLAAAIERARFLSPARPGETLNYSVRLQAMSRRTARLEGEVMIDSRPICRARMVVIMVGRDDFQRQLELD